MKMNLETFFTVGNVSKERNETFLGIGDSESSINVIRKQEPRTDCRYVCLCMNECRYLTSADVVAAFAVLLLGPFSAVCKIK